MNNFKLFTVNNESTIIAIKQAVILSKTIDDIRLVRLNYNIELDPTFLYLVCSTNKSKDIIENLYRTLPESRDDIFHSVCGNSVSLIEALMVYLILMKLLLKVILNVLSF